VEKIKEAVEASDIKTAERIAHTLKSTAALIGAKKLSDAAATVEMSFKENAVCSQKDISDLQLKLADLLNEISPPQKTNTTEVVQTVTDTIKIRELIKKLTPLIHSSNLDILEYIPEIRETLGSLGDDLISAIDDFDFDKAANILIQIQKNF
jgi:HPt (histidine-containing phosphotransfer) domain-containing protein